MCSSQWRVPPVPAHGGISTSPAARAISPSASRSRVCATSIRPSSISTATCCRSVGRARELGLEAVVETVEANAEELPFPDAAFDVYTIAFGIRNVPRIPKALAEARRVLKKGGRFLCLEFSQVDLPILERIYDQYSFRIVPKLGELVTGDAHPYRYLVESIRTFPKAETFREMIAEAGFQRASFERLTGGIVAIHSGWNL
jgi:demethylmenaquinone methyltransferase/2-methoxy-6-polyprenyl-1,4-benzoquinol methylase